MRIEEKIISNLLFNEDFCRQVAPHIKAEYFSERMESIIVTKMLKFFSEFNKLPNKDIIKIELDTAEVSDKELKSLYEYVDGLADAKDDPNWLYKTTEKFCVERSAYNGVLQCIKVMEGKDSSHTITSLPSILQSALNVSFDKHIGHDYLDDALERFEFYHKKEEKIPFDLDYLNKITDGGLSRKSLNVVLAGTNAGKTLFKCHIAAAALKQGYNVLYITSEMSEKKIGERIDANLLNTNVHDLKLFEKDVYNKRISKIREKTQGKLIIKEYPTASAHAGHFRSLIEELKTKKNFVPDLVIIDYLNICCSSRMKMGSSVNSYTYIKAIAEELRGLAVEYNIPILTSTQTTRSGYNNSDVELTDTSESFGLPATADLMIALIRSEELDALNQVMIKQLKNRYADPTIYKRFVLGVDRAKMKLYNVEESAQKNISDTGSPEQTNNAWVHKGPKIDPSKFSDFK